jgi:PPOX class probable F420-dependent enzyme
MKTAIHPETRIATVTCSTCGTSFETRSTRDSIQVEVCSACQVAPEAPDGPLHVVPIAFVLAGETLYTAVDGKPKRSRRLRRIENARERPDVTVLVDHYEDDWTQLWWLRLRGRARVLEATGAAGRRRARRPGARASGRASSRPRPRGPWAEPR